jgi:selenide,water dikinase
MGGRPLVALNLVMFPSKQLEMGLLNEILRGGHDKVLEAGASIAGGHSVDDNEPKYGLAVTGVVHPDRMLTNTGARQGDALILTKPLGSGVLFNAHRSGKLPWSEMERILPVVASLNNRALEAALKFDIHACTDVTGFAVMGHALEIARASGVRMDISFGRLPLYPNAIEMYGRGETTGSNADNRKLAEGAFRVEAGLSSHQQELLFDPQTSGGLLITVPSSQADDLIRALKAAGVDAAAHVGEVVAAGDPFVTVV